MVMQTATGTQKLSMRESNSLNTPELNVEASRPIGMILTNQNFVLNHGRTVLQENINIIIKTIDFFPNN